ncbi:MAG: hypothetical protein ACR2QM_17180 [Longimicrobiales bacterium]
MELDKHRTRGWCAAVGLVAVLGGAAACDDGSTSPGAQPGTVTATLTSPNGPEGAALVEITAPAAQVTQATGQLYSSTDDSATQVLIVLDEAGVIRFDLALPDIQSRPTYRVLQVSGPDDRLRSDLSGYTLEFTP